MHQRCVCLWHVILVGRQAGDDADFSGMSTRQRAVRRPPAAPGPRRAPGRHGRSRSHTGRPHAKVGSPGGSFTCAFRNDQWDPAKSQEVLLPVVGTATVRYDACQWYASDL
jgi:hypothetical protein